MYGAAGNVTVLVCALALASAQNSKDINITRKPWQHQDKTCQVFNENCQLFGYFNSSGDGGRFANVTAQQIFSWGPTGPTCHLSANQQIGSTLYQSTQATGQGRLRVQLTRGADDPDRQLLPKYPTCGRRQKRREDVTLVDRVVGGQTVLQGEFPWQAQIRSVYRNGSWGHWCGGVIISDRFVLTAAHCMTNALSEYEVIVGQHDLRVKETSERVFGIKEKVNLPDYLSNGTNVGDLAVVSLDVSNRPVISFSSEVRPACLIRPEDAAPAPHSTCVISGWGSTLPRAQEFPSRLRGAEVPIVSDAFCHSPEVYGSQFIPEKMVCAGNVEGKVDSCLGDSGGGLVCPASDGSWQVVGIVATGSDVCGAVGKPGIYTELQPYYEKILDIIKVLGRESRK